MRLEINTKNAFVFFIVISFVYLAYLIWGKDERMPELDVDLVDVISYAVLSVEMGGHAVSKIFKENQLNIKAKGLTDEGKAELLTKADLVSNHLMLGLLRRFPLLKVVTEESSSEHLSDREVEKYQDDNYALWMNVKEALKKFPNKRVSLDRVGIWVDPLDATQEFTEGLTDYVTVMACVTLDGRPHFGAIYRPFFNETVFGMVGYGLMDHQGHRILPKPADEIAKRIVVSRSHAGQVKELVERSFPNGEYVVEPAGGSGYKSLRLINGSAEIYIHTTAIKKWDLCAGDAIIRAVGGSLIDLDGRALDYRVDGEPLHKGGILAALRSPYTTLAKIKEHLPRRT